MTKKERDLEEAVAILSNILHKLEERGIELSPEEDKMWRNATLLLLTQ